MALSSPVLPDERPRVGRRWRGAAGLAVVLAFVLYGVVLATHMGAWAGGSDSSGYLNNARLFRAGKVRESQRVIAGAPPQNLSSFAYVPLGFIPLGHDEMVPTYPAGLSLLMMAVSPFTGWALAPHATLWLHALLGVGLMFALARAVGVSIAGSLLGALLLAVSPLYLFMAVQAMSDVPALVWCTAAVLFAWLSRRKNLWALAAGASLAVAVLVRPSDLLIIVPVALCLGAVWQRWLWLALGGLPGAVFLALFNVALYGNALATGYGAVGGIFRLEYAPPALVNYATWLPVLLTPGVLLVFALPWLARRESWLLPSIAGAWTAAFLGFYVFYYHTHEKWWYLRFLLPAFPAMILAMLLTARAISARWRISTKIWGQGIAAVAVFGWGCYWTQDRWALNAGRGEKVYLDTAQWAKTHLPENAVLASMQMSGALLYYTDFTFIRYDLIEPAHLTALERMCREQGRPLYAALFPEEQKRLLEDTMPGGWTQIGAIEHVTLWQRTPGVSTAKKPWQVLASTRTDETEVVARGVEGWYDSERSRRHAWTWSSGPARLELESWPRHDGTIRFELALRSLVPSHLTIKQEGTELFQGALGRDRLPVQLTVRVKDGHARLDFVSDTPGTRESAASDARVLAFAVYDPKLIFPTPGE